MAKGTRPHAVGGVGDLGLIEYAAQTEAGAGQQSLVLAHRVLTGQLGQQFAFQQLAIQQSAIKAGQATRIAMAVCCRLLHAPPLGFVGAGHDRRRVGKGPCAHGRRLAHHGFEQTLGGRVAEVALTAGDDRYAVKLLIGQTDMKIQAKRFGRTRYDGLARPTPLDAAQHLTHQPAIGNRCVTMTITQCPPGLLGCQGGGHRLPVIQRLSRQHLAQSWQSGLMAEQVTQGDFVLTGSGELRPVTRHRRIQFEFALAHQLQGSDCGKGLGAGKQVEDGVAVPGLLAILVGHPGPQIHNGFAADLYAQRHAALLRLIEQRRKSVAQRLEL